MLHLFEPVGNDVEVVVRFQVFEHFDGQGDECCFSGAAVYVLFSDVGCQLGICVVEVFESGFEAPVTQVFLIDDAVAVFFPEDLVYALVFVYEPVCGNTEDLRQLELAEQFFEGGSGIGLEIPQGAVEIEENVLDVIQAEDQKMMTTEDTMTDQTMTDAQR